jgi:hypothetical protein
MMDLLGPVTFHNVIINVFMIKRARFVMLIQQYAAKKANANLNMDFKLVKHLSYILNVIQAII